MPGQPAEELIRGTDIAVVDVTIPGSGCEDVVIPRQGTDSISVTNHGPESPTVLCVPDLHESFARANCQMSSL